MAKTTVAMNNTRIENAKLAALARIRSTLNSAVPSLTRIGTDDAPNRDKVREICGLAESGSGYIQIGCNRVGVDAAGGVFIPTLTTPAELDAAMSDARELVRLIDEGVER